MVEDLCVIFQPSQRHMKDVDERDKESDWKSAQKSGLNQDVSNIFLILSESGFRQIQVRPHWRWALDRGSNSDLLTGDLLLWSLIHPLRGEWLISNINATIPMLCRSWYAQEDDVRECKTLQAFADASMSSSGA